MTCTVISGLVFPGSLFPPPSVAMLKKPYVCPGTPVKVAEVAAVAAWNTVNGPPLSETKTSKVTEVRKGLEPSHFNAKELWKTCGATLLLIRLAGNSSSILTMKASRPMLGVSLHPAT